MWRPLPSRTSDDPQPTAPTRYRRAADFTALRLGRAVLAYLGVMIAIITLAPFRFEPRVVHGLTSIWSWSDLVMNVLMFVPFGFVQQLTRPRGAPPEYLRVVLLGVAISGAIEVAQLFAPARYSSLLDLGTNTAGVVMGAWAFRWLSARVPEGDAVRSLALELPLMGLVYLLIPLCWLIGLGSEGDTRRLLVLAPALITGAILGTVHAAHVRARQADDVSTRGAWPWWLVATSLGWSAVALGPAARGDVRVLLPGAAIVLASALLRDLGTRRAIAQHDTRRLELPTLRLVLPVYAIYLALAALWPLTGASPVWQGTFALALPGEAITQPFMYRALEQVAAFTLVGYMGAEYYGRDRTRGTSALLRLVRVSVVVAVMLQVARGFHEEHGASLALLCLTLFAAIVGHRLYDLQRAHIRALVQRRALLDRLARAQPASPSGQVGVGFDLDEIFIANQPRFDHGVGGKDVPEALTVRTRNRFPVPHDVADEDARAHDVFQPTAE